MAELDFSKIFGETATSKASFTDENYLNGWGYLGSTPPPYQLFDYLQSLNDQKSKYLYDSVNENKNNLLTHNTDSSAHTAILNAIKAISGMGAYDIAPSQTISAMIPLLGLGGIVAQGLGANSYVKFANGLIIQKGALSSAGIPSGSKVNFIIPMKDYQVFMNDDYANSNASNPLVYSVDHWTSNTYFTVYGIRVKTTSTNLYGSWLAIGWSV